MKVHIYRVLFKLVILNDSKSLSEESSMDGKKKPLAPSLNVTFFLNKLFLPIPQQKHFEYFFSVNLFCLLNICDGQFGGPVLILVVLNFYGGSIREGFKK